MIYIQGLASRTREFKDLARRLILLDNYIRWNSWYHMLSVALQYKSAVDTYIKSYFNTLEADCLSLKDWEKLQTTSKFLSVFDQATLITQGDQAIIDSVLPVIDALIKHFKKALVSFPLGFDYIKYSSSSRFLLPSRILTFLL